MTKLTNADKERIEQAEEFNLDGLPKEAFAIVPDEKIPAIWMLPHHNQKILRAVQRKASIEDSVDWDLMATAVLSISHRGINGKRIEADPQDVLDAAKHLAEHYRKANKPIPIELCVLI